MINDFLKMDIFFIITTFCVLFLSVLVGLVLARLFNILRHVEKITKEIAEESADIRGDVKKLRTHMTKEGMEMVDTIQDLRKGARKFFSKKKLT